MGDRVPQFSSYSRDHLRTCDERLVRVFNGVIKHFDCRVICGYRGQQAQDEAFHAGFSTLPWPESRHNTNPSLAIDVVPYPVDWKDLERFMWMGPYVIGVADCEGVKLRWGADWNGNRRTSDERFLDYAHFEIAADDPGNAEIDRLLAGAAQPQGSFGP